jgi:prepilin-type N-terminal cleavage/methylation domain-containing protein
VRSISTVRRPGGFTLLEILIVIVIIAILSSLLLWGVTAAIEAAKVSKSEGIVRSIAGTLESYKSQFGDYPPSSLDRFRVRLPNETNNGIETMVACLTSSSRKGWEPYRPPDEGLWINADNDRVDRNVTGWYFGDNQLREVSDAFGNALFYIHHSDYAAPQRHHLKYIPHAGAKVQDVKVYQSERTKTFASPGGFQLVSPGSDGILGTDRDIKSW